MKIMPAESVTRADLVGATATRRDGDTVTIYYTGDEVPLIPEQPDDAMRMQYEAEQQAAKEAEFAAYKARAGAPSYKAVAVKIAAEKLGLLDTIEAALMAEVDKAGDKSLYVWWAETDAISRGDAQWIEIEAAVDWGKGPSADELFALAAQV